VVVQQRRRAEAGPVTHSIGVRPASSTNRRANVRADMCARAARVATVCGLSRLPRIQCKITQAPTDRQVRGRLLDVLRSNDSPVTRAQLDVAWQADTAQRDRALHSLLVDGLVEQTADGRFALAGEGD
jgi:hypothetical protein